MSKQLASPPLNTVGLIESFKDLVESIRQTQKAQIRLVVLPFDCKAIDEDMQLGVYRIAQEHLTNVLKHAQASLIEVQLSCTVNELQLQILDNGVGFDTNQKRPGIGIANMTSRAIMFNGKIALESATGEGCKLDVRLPVDCSEGKCTSTITD